MSRSKRHHYVPQALQRFFCNGDGQIWYAKRTMAGGKFSKIELRNPQSAFQQRDFYTVLDENDAPSDSVERDFYGVVDDQVAKTIAEVVGTLGKGRIPVFKYEALHSFKNLTLALHRRSVDIALAHDEEEIGRSIIAGTVDDASKKLGLSREHVLEEMRFPEPKKLGRNVRVRAQTVEPVLALEALEKY